MINLGTLRLATSVHQTDFKVKNTSVTYGMGMFAANKTK